MHEPNNDVVDHQGLALRALLGLVKVGFVS